MSKQKQLFIVFCVGFLSFNLSAQGISFYVGAGTSQFLGDLGGKPTLGTDDFSDLNFPATRWVVNGGFRFHISRTFSVRTNFAYGRLAGNDKFTKNRERHQRNLSFFSPITEGSAALQINLGKTKRLYVYSGAGIFKFNPKTHYNGQTYALRQYGTEGQFYLPGRKPYSLTAFSFPFGVGYKIFETGNGYFAIEYCFRKSTTDYIDDVSTQFVDPAALSASNGTIAAELSDRSLPGIPGFSLPGNIRGDPTDMDNFSFFTINYNIRLGGAGGSGFGGGGGRNRGRQKCPDMGF